MMSVPANFVEMHKAEVRRTLIRRSSANRPCGKFALMEFSGIRVLRESYSRHYEP